MSLYPLLLNPTLHVKVWGGRRLESVMGKQLPTAEPYGESWEMHDSATVANGPLAGRTLGDLLVEYGHDLVGPGSDPAAGLPLLAKILDASDWLSVQLHPDDEQARTLEGQPRGKTEAWYVIDAEPGAKLVIGVQPGTTPDQMAAAIENNTLEDLLVYAEVVAGDVLFVRAGTIHALGPGLLIYEIQQSSDTTYRLYDWGRVGLDGRPRELHIEKGKQVANLDSLPQIVHTGHRTEQVVEIVRTPYFTTLLYQLNPDNGTRIELDPAGQRFHILTCIAGAARILADAPPLDLAKGRTALIPASTRTYTLEGTAQVLCSFQ
ncbi:MAG TPA: type I phosphomannose isomerase catalytic subunit [Spirillospora sp.]|nr:type I phosphomannose isomerase catalytic subunit [Spirillospora sp.]